jgi:hypothetical protein
MEVPTATSDWVSYRRLRLPRAKARAPETFGHASFYGWSEDKARQAAAEPEGQTFPAYLRARGFTFD